MISGRNFVEMTYFFTPIVLSKSLQNDANKEKIFVDGTPYIENFQNIIGSPYILIKKSLAITCK